MSDVAFGLFDKICMISETSSHMFVTISAKISIFVFPVVFVEIFFLFLNMGATSTFFNNISISSALTLGMFRSFRF